MLPKTRRKAELFNDGILSVWETKDHMLVREKIKNLRYGTKKISMMKQYYDQVFDEKTDKLIVVPPNPFIQKDDMIVIDGFQYRVRKKEPEVLNQTEVMKLTLEESKVRYTEVENESQSS